MSRAAKPTRKERRLVYRCLLTQGLLIGDENEIWTSDLAYRALITLRSCIAAISRLINGGHAVNASFVKAVVMQSLGSSGAPYALDEMAEYITGDDEARSYWDGIVLDAKYPVRCPLCKTAAAYIGFNFVECKARCTG